MQRDGKPPMTSTERSRRHRHNLRLVESPFSSLPHRIRTMVEASGGHRFELACLAACKLDAEQRAKFVEWWNRNFGEE
jgi:hypothetical protein